MKIAVFIDFDNLLESHKTPGILDVATKALLRTPFSGANPRGTCDIRVYGGWYEGPSMTKRAQDLSVSIGIEFPSIIRIAHPAVGGIALVAKAELALAMLEEPSHHLFDTYRKKGRPRNCRVQRPDVVGCTDPSCILPKVSKLLKSGACPIATCGVTSDELVYRHEQKIVDTMLTCDLVYARELDYCHLVLISGDDDFLPPLRTVLLRGTAVSRFHPKPNSMRRPLTVRGAQFTEFDL